jgi:hypothetical protein
LESTGQWAFVFKILFSFEGNLLPYDFSRASNDKGDPHDALVFRGYTLPGLPLSGDGRQTLWPDESGGA